MGAAPNSLPRQAALFGHDKGRPGANISRRDLFASAGQVGGGRRRIVGRLFGLRPQRCPPRKPLVRVSHETEAQLCLFG